MKLVRAKHIFPGWPTTLKAVMMDMADSIVHTKYKGVNDEKIYVDEDKIIGEILGRIPNGRHARSIGMGDVPDCRVKATGFEIEDGLFSLLSHRYDQIKIKYAIIDPPARLSEGEHVQVIGVFDGVQVEYHVVGNMVFLRTYKDGAYDASYSRILETPNIEAEEATPIEMAMLVICLLNGIYDN